MNYKFHAFISYKHNPDTKRAEKLEFALKRYGRSWYSPTRKIFRDENNLILSNDLGADILDALKKSEYLIYLASPSAAQSEWINLEVDYWCNVLDRFENLIIILTDGKIASQKDNPNLIDWAKTNVLPKSLENKSVKTPYYRSIAAMDLRNELDIGNPAFKNIVNSIVAKFKKIEPSEMIDHATKIQKRNRLYRNIAIFLLCCLAICSTVLFFKSQTNLKIANEQTALAKKNEKETLKAIEEVQKANDKEALQRFKDLEKRVVTILTANADPTILINQMIEIAESNAAKDSLLIRIAELNK